MRIIWSEIAQATFVRFIADQAGMMAVNRAVEALADDPAPLRAFVRGSYRRLRVGPYRVLYEVEGSRVARQACPHLRRERQRRGGNGTAKYPGHSSASEASTSASAGSGLARRAVTSPNGATEPGGNRSIRCWPISATITRSTGTAARIDVEAKSAGRVQGNLVRPDI